MTARGAAKAQLTTAQVASFRAKAWAAYYTGLKLGGPAENAQITITNGIDVMVAALVRAGLISASADLTFKTNIRPYFATGVGGFKGLLFEPPDQEDASSQPVLATSLMGAPRPSDKALICVSDPWAPFVSQQLADDTLRGNPLCAREVFVAHADALLAFDSNMVSHCLPNMLAMLAVGSTLLEAGKDRGKYLKTLGTVLAAVERLFPAAPASGGSHLRQTDRKRLLSHGLGDVVGVWGNGSDERTGPRGGAEDADAENWFDDPAMRNADFTKAVVMRNAKDYADAIGGTSHNERSRRYRQAINFQVGAVNALLNCIASLRTGRERAVAKAGIAACATAIDKLLQPDVLASIAGAMTNLLHPYLQRAATVGPVAIRDQLTADHGDNLGNVVKIAAVVTSKPDAADTSPLEQVLALSPTDKPFAKLLRTLATDQTWRIRFFMGFLLFTPHMRFRVGSAALVVSGANTGALLYSNVDLQEGNEVSIKLMQMHLTINMKMLLMSPQNIAYLPGVFPLSYEGGADAIYFNHNDSRQIHDYRNFITNASIFVVPTPYNWKPSDWLMDITGHFDPAVVEPSTAPAAVHHPLAGPLTALWGFRYPSAAQRHGNSQDSAQSKLNTVCSRGWSCSLQANTRGETERVITQAVGVRGRSTYPGAAAVRRGLDSMYKDHRAAAETFGSVSVR